MKVNDERDKRSGGSTALCVTCARHWVSLTVPEPSPMLSSFLSPWGSRVEFSHSKLCPPHSRRSLRPSLSHTNISQQHLQHLHHRHLRRMRTQILRGDGHVLEVQEPHPVVQGPELLPQNANVPCHGGIDRVHRVLAGTVHYVRTTY